MERARAISGIPQVGDVLNKRYRLRAELGEGGFAKAFAGQDMQKNQAVAVKVLKLTSEEDILKFSEEAFLMVGLEHPNIVAFVDYIPMKEGIRPYIVMKLAARGSLNDEIKKRRQSGDWVPVRRSILLLHQAGEGLEYLHGKKIVHRDIKPDNMLLAGEEELWLSDFGIAKKLFGEVASKTGTVIGTPQYMAPEQLRGKTEEASDIYALGITAYYLITRRLPFTGSQYEVMLKQATETPVELIQAVQNIISQDINPKIATALNPIIMKALAKDPDKRPGSVTLFTKTLVQEYDSVSGERPDRMVFTAAKKLRERWQAERAETIILDEDLWKKEANALMQKAIAFYNQEHYEEAGAAFDQVIQLDPINNFAFIFKCAALNKLGRNAEALAACDQAIRIDPVNSEAYNNKGNVLNAFGRREEALAAFDQAIRLSPKNSEVYNNKGNALNTLGRRKEALVAYDQALKLNPNYGLAYYNKGNALNALGRRKEALAAYDQALKLNPNFSQAYNNKGNVLNALGRHEEALAAFDQAIRLNPNFSEAYNSKGNALNALGRHEEALIACDRAIQLDPNNSLAYGNKGNALHSLEMREEALAAFDQAIRLSPNNSEMYNNKGFALHSLGRHEEALAAYNKALELNPSLIQAKYNRAWLEEIMRQQNKKGRGLFRKFLGN